MQLRDKAAIVGVGTTEFSKNSGRSEMMLAIEAVIAALADAGISSHEVDGMCTFTVDNNGEHEIARYIGSGGLRFFPRIPGGGGGTCAAVMQAMMAVTTGVANVVVCYRAMNERSEYRFGQPMQLQMPTADNALFAYHSLHGLMTPAAFIAMGVRRYMHETSTTSEDLARLAVTSRKHAAVNPNAFFYGRPITVDDYMNARMIADPFRLFDCCQESDGAVAFVITSAERAKSLRQKPVMIRGGAQSSPAGMISLANYYRDDISMYDEIRFCADQLYTQSGLSPDDIQAAIIYDHFLPTVLPALEAYRFCGRGEAKDFIKNGNISPGGRLPVNTNGGQVGEAYIHGMNGIAEGVRQVRGTSINQASNVENVLVTAGSAVPTSAIILGAA